MRIVQEAQALGLIVEEQDAALLALMGKTDDVIESRYIQTGMKTLPTLEAPERTSKKYPRARRRTPPKRGAPDRL
jgi:hypothetical protein